MKWLEKMAKPHSISAYLRVTAQQTYCDCTIVRAVHVCMYGYGRGQLMASVGHGQPYTVLSSPLEKLSTGMDGRENGR